VDLGSGLLLLRVGVGFGVDVGGSSTVQRLLNVMICITLSRSVASRSIIISFYREDSSRAGHGPI
jgi:hypothetical protein